MIRNVYAVLVAAALAGCAAAQTVNAPRDDALPLFVSGVEIDPARIDEFRPLVTRALQSLDVLPQGKTGADLDPDIADLRALIELIDTGKAERDAVPAALSGLGGAPLVLASKSVLFRQALDVKGRLGDYLFNKDTGELHLTVSMRSESLLTGAVSILHWHIEAKNVQVVQRVDAPPPGGLHFPGTIPIPADRLNASDPDSIWARNLDHKLFAKGTDITVTEIWRQNVDGSVELLDPSAYASLYATDADSCIDMMFSGHPPAMWLPEQEAWCLGRCDSPYVMNSR